MCDFVSLCTIFNPAFGCHTPVKRIVLYCIVCCDVKKHGAVKTMIPMRKLKILLVDKMPDSRKLGDRTRQIAGNYARTKCNIKNPNSEK